MKKLVILLMILFFCSILVAQKNIVVVNLEKTSVTLKQGSKIYKVPARSGNNIKSIRIPSEGIFRVKGSGVDDRTPYLKSNTKVLRLPYYLFKDSSGEWRISEETEDSEKVYRMFNALGRSDLTKIVKEKEDKFYDGLYEAGSKVNVEAKKREYKLSTRDEYQFFNPKEFGKLTQAENLIKNKKYLDGFNKIKALADEGFPPAQVALAELYYKGNVVSRDLKKALVYATKAEKTGYKDAFGIIRKIKAVL